MPYKKRRFAPVPIDDIRDIVTIWLVDGVPTEYAATAVEVGDIRFTPYGLRVVADLVFYDGGTDDGAYILHFSRGCNGNFILECFSRTLPGGDVSGHARAHSTYAVKRRGGVAPKAV